MESLKNYTFAEAVKNVITLAAERQFTKLRGAIEGVDTLESELVDSLTAKMSIPMRKIYCGHLYSVVGKVMMPEYINNSAEISAKISDSNRLEKVYFEGNEFSVLADFVKQDQERIQAPFAGTKATPEEICMLIEKRADAFSQNYSTVLQSQVGKVFGKIHPHEKAIPAPASSASASAGEKTQVAGKTTGS